VGLVTDVGLFLQGLAAKLAVPESGDRRRWPH
jgi:hypothetical protein